MTRHPKEADRLKKILDLMLGSWNLGYRIDDGIMIVTTKEKLDSTLETRVYDCHDILSADTDRFHRFSKRQKEDNQPVAGTPIGGGSPSVAAGPPMGPSTGSITTEQKKTAPAMGGRDLNSAGLGFGTTESRSGAGAPASTKVDKPQTPVDDLIEVITTSIAPQTWNEQGGPGTICEYDGLLIINATSAVQTQVADLLDKISIRLTAREKK